MTDAEKLRRAVDEGEFRGDTGPLLVAEVRRLRTERDLIIESCLIGPVLVAGQEPEMRWLWVNSWKRGNEGSREAAVAAFCRAAGIKIEGD